MNARERKIRQMMIQGLSRKEAESKIDERMSRDKSQAQRNYELVKASVAWSEKLGFVTIP